MSAPDAPRDEIAQTNLNDPLPSNNVIDNSVQIENETQSCWQRTKRKFHFVWTYVKPPIAYIWDIGVDISRTVHYFQQADHAVGGISIGIIVAAILASMKYKWQMNTAEFRKRSDSSAGIENQHLNGDDAVTIARPDTDEPSCGTKFLDSIVLVWYWRKLRSAWRSGELKSKNEYMRDTSLLAIIENFIENGPQLNLSWFYVFWIKEEIAFVPSIIMKSISLLLLTWSIPAYYKAVKRGKGEENLTKCSMLLIYLWNVLQIVPRILIISMFGAEYPIPALIYLGCHVAVMIITLMCVVEDNPDLCDSVCMQGLHCAVFGLMYIYTYVDIAQDRHKFKAALVFYIVSVAGNCFIVYYYLFTTASFVLIGIYLGGVAFMILYYSVGCLKSCKKE